MTAGGGLRTIPNGETCSVSTVTARRPVPDENLSSAGNSSLTMREEEEENCGSPSVVWKERGLLQSSSRAFTVVKCHLATRERLGDGTRMASDLRRGVNPASYTPGEHGVAQWILLARFCLRRRPYSAVPIWARWNLMMRTSSNGRSSVSKLRKHATHVHALSAYELTRL